jgi:hypothetical protein
MSFYNRYRRPVIAAPQQTRESINYDLKEDLKGSIGMMKGVLEKAKLSHRITQVDKFVFQIKIKGVATPITAEKKTFWRNNWTFSINGERILFNYAHDIETFMGLINMGLVERCLYWLSCYDPTAWASDDTSKGNSAIMILERAKKLYAQGTQIEQKRILVEANKRKINYLKQ